MLHIVHENGAMPMSFPVNPSAQFEPGQISQLCVQGNQILMGVSNGKAPFGIIDDIRTRSFSNVSWNETHIIQAPAALSATNKYITTQEIKWELEYPNVIPSSFQSSVQCLLKEKNGIIVFPTGTELNYDAAGSGTPDSIKVVVNYSYYIANIPGDDSVSGSGQVTIWFGKILFQTNMFETNQSYPVNAPLYVSEYGLLTSRKPSDYHPVAALCTAPPSSLNQFIEALWIA